MYWLSTIKHMVPLALAYRFVLGSGAAIVGLVSPAMAQTASQITPQTFRPVGNSGGSSVVFSGQPGLGTPTGAERLNVRVGSVAIEGGLAQLEAENRAIVARLAGRRVPASEIFAAARDLESSYAKAGYVLARVVLPAQTVKDGASLRFVVVNGYIERLDTKNLPDQVRQRVEDLLRPLVGQRGLQVGEIERKLLLAGDTPGVSLRSTLSPGGESGGAVLIVDGAYRPVSAFAAVDNTLSRSLGHWTLGTGLDLNTVLGAGETLYIRALGHPAGDGSNGYGSILGDYPRVRTLSAGGLIPLGTDGLTLNVEGTESRASPISGTLQSNSVYDRLSTRLRYPWIRGRQFNLYSEASFDVTSEKLRLLVPGASLPLSLDRLRIFRFAQDGDVRLETGGLLAMRGQVSFGIDGLGARSAADATPLLPLSRQGADAQFQKFEGVVSFAQPIAEHLAAGIYARGQTSFGQVLPRSEQIGIASFQELSTFDAGTLGGDSGWVVRGELSAPYVVPLGGNAVSVAPYVFGATGALYLERPTALEVGRLSVSSVGVGLRLAGSLGPDLPFGSLSLEFGRRFRNDSLPDSNRFTLVGSLRY